MKSSKTTKIAFSLPRSVFIDLENETKRRKKPRSAVIVSILGEWFARDAARSRDERYREGYRRRPEQPNDVALPSIATWEPW
jgi:hypothetical protein